MPSAELQAAFAVLLCVMMGYSRDSYRFSLLARAFGMWCVGIQERGGPPTAERYAATNPFPHCIQCICSLARCLSLGVYSKDSQNLSFSRQPQLMRMNLVAY